MKTPKRLSSQFKRKSGVNFKTTPVKVSSGKVPSHTKSVKVPKTKVPRQKFTMVDGVRTLYAKDSRIHNEIKK